MGGDEAAATRPRRRSIFGEGVGGALPAHLTLEGLRQRVRGFVDGFLGSGEAEEAVRCFRELAQEAAGCLDEVAVCALRLALARTPQQRETLAGLLQRLHKEEVLDTPALVRGFAKLACSWEDLAVDDGAQAPVALVGLVLGCVHAGCIERAFLTRLPEGLLASAVRDRQQGDEGPASEELQEVVHRLQEFKRTVEEAALLEPPTRCAWGCAPIADRVARALRKLAMPECQHEFVKRALVAALDWTAEQRKFCISLLARLKEDEVLSAEDLEWGAVRLLGQLEDITLDCPESAGLVAEHLRGLVAKGLLPNSFVERCRFLRVGGAAGLAVVDAVQRQLPAAEATAAVVAAKAQRQEEDKASASDRPEAETAEGPALQEERPEEGRDRGEEEASAAAPHNEEIVGEDAEAESEKKGDKADGGVADGEDGHEEEAGKKAEGQEEDQEDEQEEEEEEDEEEEQEEDDEEQEGEGKGEVGQEAVAEEAKKPSKEDGAEAKGVAAPPAEAGAGAGASLRPAGPLSGAGSLTGGVSLRPGGGALSGGLTGGLSLRPGGGGGLRPGGAGSLSGLTAMSLRPSGGGGSSRPSGGSAARPDVGSDGYPASGSAVASGAPADRPGKRGGRGARQGAAKEEESGSWRNDAARTKASKASQKKERRGKEADKEERDRGSAPKPPKVEKLSVSEDSWAAQQRRRRELEGGASGSGSAAAPNDEEITRRMKSILNKLTLEKFDDLVRQLTQCGISTETHVRIIMEEVFEKAVTQHHFIEMYTSLCVYLSDWCKEQAKVGNFKRILLDQCQASFEANLHPSEEEAAKKKKQKEDLTPEEAEELELQRLRMKTRVMGTAKFVGQLLAKRILASKVLIACSEELLLDPNPGTLESLAGLLTVVGPEFDGPGWTYYEALNGIFNKVKSLAKDKQLPSRTRFLLQDVLDLRATGWVDRKKATQKLEKPKTLEEIAGGAS